MPDLLSVDFSSVMATEFARTQRADDGKLHASSAGAPLRHTQLEAAGAPKKPRAFGDEITLGIGTMIHEWLHNALRRQGVPYMAEVDLTPWMPRGWGGTADAVIWSPEYRAFVLVDFKSSKPEALRWRIRDGASADHILQTSIYWQSLKKMGIPIVKKIAVLYIPKGSTRNKDDVIEPLLVDFDPLPVRALTARMNERKARVDEYVESIGYPEDPRQTSDYLTDKLEPEQPMEQRIYRDSASGADVLKLVPNWSAAYCPFVEELCGCGAQKSVTIGRFDDVGEYKARKGYEEFAPVIRP